MKFFVYFWEGYYLYLEAGSYDEILKEAREIAKDLGSEVGYIVKLPS